MLYHAVHHTVPPMPFHHSVEKQGVMVGDGDMFDKIVVYLLPMNSKMSPVPAGQELLLQF
jgi:hypothetical protein